MFYPHSSGNWGASFNNIMEYKFYKAGYETPVVEVLHVEVEKGFAVSDGGDTPEYDV